MPIQDGASDPVSARELLLADHKHISELLAKNEQGGESRVNLFLTLVTAGVAGLVALITGAAGMTHEEMRAVIVIALISLLVIGTVIWLRMIKRDVSTDQFAYQLDLIRRTFKQQLDRTGALASYDPFPRSCPPKPRRFGGLGDTVAVLNGFLAAGIAAAVVLPAAPSMDDGIMLGRAAIIAVAAGISVAAFQVIYANRQEMKVRSKLCDLAGAPTHAGGVVYEMVGGAVRYLLIRPKSGQNEWVLPQGHIEPDEDHAAAALREVREETGVVAAVVGFIDQTRFERQGRIQRSKFYLMQKLVQTDEGEGRGSEWFSYDDAMQKLSHPESRCMLRIAHERLAELPAALRT